ncbi:MAG: hypothetical protein JWP01_844 [Myxococcales bacterium]|nr:hypothetical protein [Myxococcales bacterium]
MAIAAVLFSAGSAIAQPVDPGAGSGPAADPGSGSGWVTGSGSGSGSATDPGSGSGSGSATGSGSASGSATGSGSVTDPGSAPGSGSASGSGSATDPGSGSGSGSGSGRVIQLPTDINAPEVSASASPSVVRLGGRFTVFVTATFGDGVEVNLREPLELGSAFEIRRKDSEDRARADGKRTREWQIDVLAWELGELRIPPIAVTYTVGGRAGQVETNIIPLRVEGVLGDVVDDPKAVRDMHPPRQLVARDWFWLWVGSAAGGVLIVGLGTLWWLRRRRRHTVELTGGVVASPRRIDMTGKRALEALLAIHGSGVLDREDDRKSGYAEMVDVIRDYIGARYHVATRDLTTSELLRRLRAAPAEERAMIGTWLERCDVVKYGGLRATAGEAHGVLDDARALVVTTTQIHDGAAKGGATPTTPGEAVP